MDRHSIEDDDADLVFGLPRQDVLADIAAGLDDIKHGRTVPVDVVLASLDSMIATFEGESALTDRDGDRSTQRSSSD